MKHRLKILSVNLQLLHRQNDGRTDRYSKDDIRISVSVAAKEPEMEDVTYLQIDNMFGLILFICDLNNE